VRRAGPLIGSVAYPWLALRQAAKALLRAGLLPDKRDDASYARFVMVRNPDSTQLVYFTVLFQHHFCISAIYL
jgi:hypothetical protein